VERGGRKGEETFSVGENLKGQFVAEGRLVEGKSDETSIIPGSRLLGWRPQSSRKMRKSVKKGGLVI